ncbi:hypothetical protein [Bacillus sp. T3]|uniref:hypothetical protein n=1 Tax=Bacillus sp. T3 TaxID=467262 RepID=UPI002982AF6C|nr:hypothetical protein [Bacillus sp. T3]
MSQQEERKKVFMTELHHLVEEDYISGKQFNEMAKAYQRYYAELSVQQDNRMEIPHEKKPEIQLQSSRQVPEQIKQKHVKPIPPKQIQEKKRLSQEEQRERNISWSLNLGVILLLIGGLFVATSNWATMENWMKSGLIGLVSLLFFGISYLANKVLKIEKTGFAFIVLGSLFLPIFLLSIGWFELIGGYYSFTGEGRFLFGFISSLLVIPIYLLIAKRLSSRLFVWFSYLATTVAVAYLIASFKLERDWFYFGFMLYNVLTVFLFHRFKTKDAYKLFTKELVVFAQIQLILSSLITMVFYENHLVNGINLFITAAVYLAMVYVSGRKEYHFVFSALIVYGAYQVIENSVLVDYYEVLFVLVGISFLAVPKLLDEQQQWKKVFQLTSSIVSMIAFVYISMDALFTNMRMENPSWALILAYFLLSGQFLYLANEMKALLFQYLSPIFIVAGMYELIQFFNSWFGLDDLHTPIFLIGFGLYTILGSVIHFPMLSSIIKSSRDIGLLVMSAIIFLALIDQHQLELGIILILFTVPLYLCIHLEDRKGYKNVASWLLPLSNAVAFSAFGEVLRLNSFFYQQYLGISMNAILGSAICFISYFGWKKVKKEELAWNSFMIAQLFYTFGILFVVTFNVNELWMRPLVFLGGIGVYVAFFNLTKYKWIPYLIAVTTLISYFTILQSIYLKVMVPTSIIYLENIIAAVLLLSLSYLMKNYSASIANGFAWVGHIYLPLAFGLSFFSFVEKSFISFLIGIVLYMTSAYLVKTEWKCKTFLYAGFTTLYLTVLTGMMNYHIKLELSYAFFITSLMIAVYGLLAGHRFQHYTKYYLVPFSMIGIAGFISSYPYSINLYIVTILYCVCLLLYLIKVEWGKMTVLPLLLLFGATMQYLQNADYPTETKLLIVSIFGILLFIIGKIVYNQFYQEDEKGTVIQLDGYTITAFLYLGSGYLFISDAIWSKFIPGILISVGLALQFNRVPERYRVWIKLIAGIYLLEPYYSTVLNLQLPALLEREIVVLPWLIVVIYLGRCLNGKYQQLMNRLHWFVLILISLALIQDGLESSTVYDALILGSLSLASMLSGMFMKVKSYFLVGSGVLLLNVFLQTRPFWGNMPWWAYLLITGSILIAVASYNEWHKQKSARGETTALTILKQKLVHWYKKWD